MKIKCDLQSIKKPGIEWLAIAKSFLKGFAGAIGAIIAYIVFILVVVWYIRKSDSTIANAIKTAIGYSRPAVMLRETQYVSDERTK